MNLTVVPRLAAAYRLMLLVQPSSAAAEHTFPKLLLFEAEPVPMCTSYTFSGNQLRM